MSLSDDLTRGDILALSEELRQISAKLEDTSALIPSRRITIGEGPDAFSQSFSSLTELFIKRVDFYRTQLNKLALSLPPGRKHRKKKDVSD